MALHLETNCPVVTKYDALNHFVQLYSSLTQHLRIEVSDVEFVLALVTLPIEVHQITRDGVDELLIVGEEGEGLVDGALHQVLLVSHQSVEEGQFQILQEVVISEGDELLPALQFQHRLDVVHISDRAQLTECALGLDLGAVVHCEAEVLLLGSEHLP